MAKKTGKELVKWDEEFAGLAKASTAGMDLPTAKWISIKSGRLKFQGAEVPGNEIQAVILGWVHENQYYTEDYSSDAAQVPSCYAFGTDQDDMQPHEKVSEPQNDSCATCPLNEWGSDPNGGAGKACKNVLRLALIAESDLEDLSSAEIVYMKVPVMSTKNFMVYAKKKVADTMKRPYWAVVTTIRVEPDDRSQFKVLFDMESLIEDSDLFSPLKELWEKTMDSIDFPYPENIEREQKPKRGKPAPKGQKFTKRR